MKRTIDGYTFDFPDANSIEKFDGPLHGMSQAMKAVDVVIELPEWRLFIEIKNFNQQHQGEPSLISDQVYDPYNDESRARLTQLCDNLVYKYRDSLLYHWCMASEEKESIFVFLTDWQSNLLTDLPMRLFHRFPTKGYTPRWQRSFVHSFKVVNAHLWNKSELSKLGHIS